MPLLNDRIYEIAKVLRPLKLCLGELRSFYTDLSHLPSNSSVRGKASKNPRRPLHTSRPVAGSFPHFKSFKVGDREFRLEYVERLVPGDLEKAVFKAVLRYEEQTTDVVVKFTPTYCVRAHQIAWGKQSAPKLWYCRHEEGVGMFVVVMDFFEGRHVDDLTDLPEDVLKQLRETIETLHAEKIVYGDWRGPNVMVADDGRVGCYSISTGQVKKGLRCIRLISTWTRRGGIGMSKDLNRKSLTSEVVLRLMYKKLYMARVEFAETRFFTIVKYPGPQRLISLDHWRQIRLTVDLVMPS